MINREVKRDLFYLFCSLSFFFAFFFMNNDIKEVQGKENINFTGVDEPVERCIPRYEDRAFRQEDGSIIVRCVKIAIPENVYYDEPCKELGLFNPENYPAECLIE